MGTRDRTHRSHTSPLLHSEVEDLHNWVNYNHTMHRTIPTDFEKNIGGDAGKIECVVACQLR